MYFKAPFGTASGDFMMADIPYSHLPGSRPVLCNAPVNGTGAGYRYDGRTDGGGISDTDKLGKPASEYTLVRSSATDHGMA